MLRTVLQEIGSSSNGTSVTVPGGRSDFYLKLRAFIPPAWIYGPDACINSSNVVLHTIYGGDNRGFDPFSPRYRTDSEVFVSTLTGSAISPALFDAGTTYRYASDALNPDGYTLTSDAILNDCHYTDKVVKEPSTNMHVSVSGGGSTVHANFYGSATDLATAAQSWAPSLDWNVTYTISTANPVIPAYTIEYTHDCYPAHEAYIGTQLVYGYKPSSNGAFAVGTCLAGLGQISGATIGTVN